MVETREMGSWEEFERDISELERERAGLVEARSPLYVSPILYRGQSSSTWKLKTTLERYWPHPAPLPVDSYYERILAAKPQIESCTGRRWDSPSPEEFSRILREQETPTLPGLPGYEYWAYLRHVGFPSPLLDWSRSPYIAAFFAFSGAGSEPDARESVAIFAYVECIGLPKQRHPGEVYVSTTGPSVRTHVRHVLQQSDYSVSLVRVGAAWCFESHEDAFPSRQREVLLKYTIPATERAKVLSLLDRFNLNAFSLFGSEEGLAQSAANRELLFKRAGR